MAWNPAPVIAALRDFGEKFDRPVVVTFSLDADGERFHITTYGKSKKLCKLAGAFGDQIAQLVLDGTITPPEVEPATSTQAQVWQRVGAVEVRQ